MADAEATGTTMPVLHVLYVNHRGEEGWRRVTPQRVWWGCTEWHPESQWLLRAHDQDKDATRDFAVADVRWMGGHRPSPEGLPVPPVGDPDAMAWAESFVAHVERLPGLPYDAGTMVGWFANAMCAEHDSVAPPLRELLERCEEFMRAFLEGKSFTTEALRALYLDVRERVVDEAAPDKPPMPGVTA